MRPMPAGVAEFDREPKIRRQLRDEIAESRFLFSAAHRRAGVGSERPAIWARAVPRRVKKGEQLRAAIAQPTQMGDFARQLAGKTKVRRSHFHPALRDCFRGCAIKGGVDLDCRKITGVNFKPSIRRPVLWIKHAAPFVEAPGTGADPDFLLLDQVQNGGRVQAAAQGADALYSVSELNAIVALFRAKIPRRKGPLNLTETSIVHYPADSDECIEFEFFSSSRQPVLFSRSGALPRSFLSRTKRKSITGRPARKRSAEMQTNCSRKRRQPSKPGTADGRSRFTSGW